MIATSLTTFCREAKNPFSSARFSRQFSRQSVVSDGATNQTIPTRPRQKCRDSVDTGKMKLADPEQISLRYRNYVPFWT